MFWFPRLEVRTCTELRHTFDNVACLAYLGSLKSFLYIDCTVLPSATLVNPMPHARPRVPCELPAFHAHSLTLLRFCTRCKCRGASAKACGSRRIYSGKSLESLPPRISQEATITCGSKHVSSVLNSFLTIRLNWVCDFGWAFQFWFRFRLNT